MKNKATTKAINKAVGAALKGPLRGASSKPAPKLPLSKPPVSPPPAAAKPGMTTSASGDLRSTGVRPLPPSTKRAGMKKGGKVKKGGK